MLRVNPELGTGDRFEEQSNNVSSRSPYEQKERGKWQRKVFVAEFPSDHSMHVFSRDSVVNIISSVYHECA